MCTGECTGNTFVPRTFRLSGEKTNLLGLILRIRSGLQDYLKLASKEYTPYYRMAKEYPGDFL